MILPEGPFDIVYADPPWRFATRSEKGRDRCPDGLVETSTRAAQRSNMAERHYPTMTTEEICALDVGTIAPNAVLLMWVIDPMLPDAMKVLDAWGFTYKTVGFYWAKLNKAGDGFPMGTGYYTRANPEQCWLATRGRPPKRLHGGIAKLISDDHCRLCDGTGNFYGDPEVGACPCGLEPKLIVSHRREHSRKPDEAYDRIDKLWGPAGINRRLEMFCREPRAGWDVFGNQLDRFTPESRYPLTDRPCRHSNRDLLG